MFPKQILISKEKALGLLTLTTLITGCGMATETENPLLLFPSPVVTPVSQENYELVPLVEITSLEATRLPQLVPVKNIPWGVFVLMASDSQYAQKDVVSRIQGSFEIGLTLAQEGGRHPEDQVAIFYLYDGNRFYNQELGDQAKILKLAPKGPLSKPIRDYGTEAIFLPSLSPTLEELGEPNTGDPQVLEKLLKAQTKVIFDHEALVLLGHGDPDTLLYDFNNGPRWVSFMSLEELTQVLAQHPQVEVLVLGGCNMSEWETLSKIALAAPQLKYILAFQDFGVTLEFPGQEVAYHLATSNPQASEVAKLMVEKTNHEGMAFFAHDAEKLRELQNQENPTFANLAALLWQKAQDPMLLSQFVKARFSPEVVKSENNWGVDLWTYLDVLEKGLTDELNYSANDPLIMAIKEMKIEAKKVVVVANNQRNELHGLGILFAKPERLAGYKTNYFGDPNWLKFVEKVMVEAQRQGLVESN